MNILEALMGKKYPEFKSVVYSDDNFTEVTVRRTLSPDHVELDSPGYTENKFKKRIPILKSIEVYKADKESGQTIAVTVLADASKLGPLEKHTKFNNVETINTLVQIASAISKVAEDKLSEPEVLKGVGLDCKPFICTDNEPEETQADA